jgi:methionyl-tRNA formyltransferase
MRIVFAGTPEFAKVALEQLAQAGHEIVLVLTQPDRPAGRGMQLQPSAVKRCAQAHGWALCQPRSLRLDGKFPQDALAAQTALVQAQADAMVVAAYGLLLPQWVLDCMRSTPAQRGCLNIHGSLLPRWRGAAPIHRAIEAGDSHTGVTIMQMDAGLDTGDMLLVQSIPIAEHDTTASLHDKVADLGAGMVVQALALAAQGALQPQTQATQGVTYAHKIEKHEAAIDWQQSAPQIVRRVRAFNPFPAASMVLHGETIKVWEAKVAVDAAVAVDKPVADPSPAAPACGCVLAVSDEGIVVAAGEGAVRITQLQRAGAKRLAVADFLRGFEVKAGMQLDLGSAAQVAVDKVAAGDAAVGNVSAAGKAA